MDPLKNSMVWKILNASAYEIIGLVVAIALLGGVIVWLKRTIYAEDDSLAVDHMLLSQASDMLQQGELSEDEYKSIKGKLVGRLEGELVGGSESVSNRTDASAGGSVNQDGPASPKSSDDHKD